MLKYQEEYLTLIDVGRLNRLTTAEIILLIAMREVEAGAPRNEFNLNRARDTDLRTQANGVANLIRNAEFQYQGYLKKNEGTLMPFLEFFRQLISSMEVVIRDKNWLSDVAYHMVVIDKEYSFKGEEDGCENNNRLG